MLSSRLIDGQFPNYRQLLPESVEHELRLASAELTDVVRRISLLAQKNAPLRLSFSEGTLSVSAQTPDVGEASEAIPVPYHGELVRDRLQPRVPPRRAREHRHRRAGAEADQPAAPRPDRISGHRRLRLPDHADPPERVKSCPSPPDVLPADRGPRCSSRASRCATSGPTIAPRHGSGRADGRPRPERRRQVEPARGRLLRLHGPLAADPRRPRARPLRRPCDTRDGRGDGRGAASTS